MNIQVENKNKMCRNLLEVCSKTIKIKSVFPKKGMNKNKMAKRTLSLPLLPGQL